MHDVVEGLTLHTPQPPDDQLIGTLCKDAIEKHLAPAIPTINTIADDHVRNLLFDEYTEKCDLVLGLAYAWALVGLPVYLTNYSPESTEREDLMTLECNGTPLTLMTRTDISSKLVQGVGKLIHNFKTVTEPNKRWKEQWRYDQQLMTEVMTAEHATGESINGVVMVGLVKGKKIEYPEDSGVWRHNNPLIQCWYRPGEPPMVEPEYHARYKFSCSEPHKMKNGHNCPGGKFHTLSKGVTKRRVADVYPGGVPAWVHWLAGNDRDLIAMQILQLEPISRNDWEVERWKRMVVPRELTINNLGRVVQHDGVVDEQLLDVHFPMHTGHGNCIRPNYCPYMRICWDLVSPDDVDVYKVRDPNHQAEKDLLQSVRQAERQLEQQSKEDTA